MQGYKIIWHFGLIVQYYKVNIILWCACATGTWSHNLHTVSTICTHVPKVYAGILQLPPIMSCIYGLWNGVNVHFTYIMLYWGQGKLL